MSLPNRCALLLTAIISFLAFASGAQSGATSPHAAIPPSPNDVLRSAHTIFIRTKSIYFNPSTLEHALLQHEELQQWGLAVTRNEAEADLVIEVKRKLFTTSFVYSVIDPSRQVVVASGRVNSIGGTVEGKITHSLMQKLRAAHQR
jgi:hypothetical protein